MSPMHVRDMDLNLLLALEALVEERSVTRAARRRGITQSAMSRALGRLRASMGDPLLVRTGSAMGLTPRAEKIGPALAAALQALDGIVSTRPTFDPARARRTFRVATADYGIAVAVPPLLARLAAEAPGIALDMVPIPGDLDAALASGAIDAAIAPRRPSTSGLVWTRLFTEHNVCIARVGHPAIGGTLSLETYCALSHVMVSPEGRASAVDQALEERGLQRRVSLRVPSFLVAPLVVATSDLIATVASRVAGRFAGPLSLRVLELPFALPEFALALGWHERVRQEPGHAWLRRLVAAAARDPG